MNRKLFETTYVLDQIDQVAEQLLQATAGATLFAFSGEMGAGKTTLIHALCAAMGVTDRVSSPTFALVNEYAVPGDTRVIYHMDWYRLRDAGEAIQAGLEDCLLDARAGRAFCFAEWPENAFGLLQPPYIRISIGTNTAGDRHLEAELISE